MVGLRQIAVLVLGLIAAGCGNTIFAAKANSAANKLEEARELGAEELAPYEYWLAEEYLKKSRSEAAEADYGDAIILAGESEEYSTKAISQTRAAHRGAGR